MVEFNNSWLPCGQPPALLCVLQFYAIPEQKRQQTKKINFSKSKMVQEYLSLTPEGEDSPLALEVLQIDAMVIGLTSEVTMLMGFNNKTSRTLEGELNFPLPEVIYLINFAN
jgi:hypothetical protein